MNRAKDIGFEYCPMLWGEKNKDDFASVVAKGGWTCVLGFNEVNEVGQANLSPAAALSLWNQYIRPLKSKGTTLGAPSFSSRPNGNAWMLSFLELCGGDTHCDIDFCPVHFYDTTIEKFETYINNWRTTVPWCPIWVTEYACENFNGGPQCTSDYTTQFHHSVAAWMNGLSWVHRYFAFGPLEDLVGVNPDNQMMDPSTGKPNALGSWYINQS